MNATNQGFLPSLPKLLIKHPLSHHCIFPYIPECEGIVLLSTLLCSPLSAAKWPRATPTPHHRMAVCHFHVLLHTGAGGLHRSSVLWVLN